jgi:glucose/arabinose dehydrogenase
MNLMTRLRRVLGVVLAATLAGACSTATSPGPLASPAVTPAESPSTTSPTSPTSTGAATTPPAGLSGPFNPASVDVRLDRFVEGFRAPLAVVSPDDGSGRLFVVEQGGLIRIVRDGRIAPDPFLDVSGLISAGGEQGLLGFAFHPDYPDDSRVFVDYTNVDGDTEVVAYSTDPSDPDLVDRDSGQRLVLVDQPYRNHNGGALAFGPDGYLYISLGDGGSGGDPHGNGQKLSTMLGKILRIDVDRSLQGRAYAVPADNPYVATEGAEPAVFVTGLRNPWRFSFDRASGDLWIGDVGQTHWEEIDVVRSGTSGQNFGWNRMEGSHCFRPETGCDQSGLTLPITDYHHGNGCTVIGGYVYRGRAQAGLAGGYIFGDYCSGTIWAIDASVDGRQEPVAVGQAGATLSSFGEGEGGELYATRLTPGELLRVVAAPR